MDHLWGDYSGVITLRDGGHASTDRPDMLHSLEDSIVDGPGDSAQDVKSLAHRLEVCLDQVIESSLEVRFNFRHFRLSEVVPAKEEVLPRCWWVNHR